MPINYSLIGIRIKETRNQQGISAEELAELANLSSVSATLKMPSGNPV